MYNEEFQTARVIENSATDYVLGNAIQQKSHKGILISKLIAGICWVVHYLCIDGIAGAIPNLVGIFRELVFVNRKKHKWANLVIL